jgi:uncharacterized protein YjbJ (UPF0337 family)
MAGTGDKIVGKAKELEGKLTGDEVREGQGKAQQTQGTVKQKGQALKDQAEGAVRQVTGSATGDTAGKTRGRAQRTKGKLES